MNGRIMRCLKAHHQKLLIKKLNLQLDFSQEENIKNATKSISALDASHYASKSIEKRDLDNY